MSIYVSGVERLGFVILDLDDVRENGGTVLEDDVFELGLNVVELAVECLFGGGDGSLDRDAWGRFGDLLWGGRLMRDQWRVEGKKRTRLDEGAAEGDNLVVLESDVGNGVGESDAVLCTVASEGRWHGSAEMD